VVQTFSNEKLTIRPNVELDECNKLCIHKFSIWDHLGSDKVCVYKNQCFDFGQTWSNDPFDDLKSKKLNTKLLEIIKIYI